MNQNQKVIRGSEVVAHPAWNPTIRELIHDLAATPDRQCMRVTVDGVEVEVRTRVPRGPRCDVDRTGSTACSRDNRSHCGFPICVGGPHNQLLRPVVTARFGLSDREFDVARLVVEGHGNIDIATRLGVTVGTVKRHIYNIFNKVGVDTRAHLLYRLMWRDNFRAPLREREAGYR
jgi:DNA-binding CsgD family transcriptional regulator